MSELSANDLRQWGAWEKAGMVGHMRDLYRFVIPGRVHDTIVRYCTGSDSVTYEGETYYPHPCKHDSIKRNSSSDETSISLAATKFWLTAIFDGTIKRLDVTIQRYRTELERAVTLFTGQANKHTLANNIMTIECASSYEASQAMLMVYYTQTHCNHDIYGPYCGMSFDACKHIIPAGQWRKVSGRTIQLKGDFHLDQVYWKDCLVIYDINVDDEETDQTILFETDNMAQAIGSQSIMTRYAISGLVDPFKTDLTIAPNCCLLPERCRDIMGNLARSCAFPDLPLYNPTTTDLANNMNRGGPFGPPGRSPYRFGKY